MKLTVDRARRALAPRRRRRRAAALVFAQVAATLVLVIGLQSPAAAGPQPVMYGYIPLPANEFVAALEAMRSGAGTELDFTVGITNAGGGAIMTYDHWEDGYEADLANPTQSTTLVFGDANTANGNAATYCSVCTGDLLPQGAPLIMRNNVATPRPSSGAPIRFDGRDKVGSTRGFAITAGGFTTTRLSLHSAVLSSYDTSKYANAYTVPVGTDTPVPSGASNPFSYSSTLVQAAQSGTVVNIDTDADGTADVTSTLSEGEVLQTTGIREGATVRSSKPVQVHLITGDTSANYESRSYTLFADDVLTDDYLSPAGSSASGFVTTNFLYNPTDAAITVTPTCTGCSGTITVPANASAAYNSPLGRGVKFESTGGERFIAVAGVGAHSGAGGGTDSSSSWDWGFTMIPTSQLTTQVVLGWAPGNSNNPPSSPSGNRDDNPVWISTTEDTTLRVDLDGNPATGAITTADCFGRHDLEIPVTAFASTRIVDTADGNMTGARIYTCDETLIAGAWGEDPQNAPVGSPGFDAGYTIIPSTTMVVDKTAAIADDPDGNNEFSPGDTVTYSVSIADAGSLAFTNIEMTDVIAPGMTYVPDSTTYDDGSGDPPAAYPDDVPPAATPFPFDEGGNSLPTIEAGQVVVVRFDVTVDRPYLADDGSLRNTACVVAQEASACDSSEDPLTDADLELTKSLVGNPVRVGDEATFRIEVDNQGPSTAHSIEVTDVLPAGTTFVSSDPSQGAYDEATGLWNVGTLVSGGSATLDVTVTIDQLSVTNFAEITSAAAWDPDSSPGENPLDDQNPPDEDDEDSVTVTVSPALVDLSLTKVATDVGTYVGDEATFEITVTNDGPSTATGVAVADALPAGLGFVSASATQGSYEVGSGSWSVGTLTDGAAATLTVVVTVDTTDEVTNTAQVSAADQDDADSTPANDDPTEDDQASAPVQVDPLIDLEVSKDVVAAPTYLGGEATFRVTVTNQGPSPATGVEVTDDLGDDLTFVSSDRPGTYNPTTGVWTVGDLAVGGSATIDIVATVDLLTADNLAEVTAANEDDIDSQPGENPLSTVSPPDQDDEARTTLTVEPLADLSLTKEQTGTPTYLGDQTSFEITVTNDGPSPATGVEVTDLLPAGLEFDAASASQGTYDETTGVWSVGTLAVGADAILTLDVTVNAETALNVAQVTAVNEDDPDSSPAENPLDEQSPPDEDDEDQALVQVDELIDLSLTKTATTSPTYVGDEAAFEITVTNDGPSIATGVVVADPVPAGLTFDAASASQGTYDDATGTWSVGDLAVGGSATLTISTTATGDGQITNVAEVVAHDQHDRDSEPDNGDLAEDDQDEVTVEVAELIDLSLTKELLGDPTHIGDAGTYRITVSNDGPSDASGVVVSDLLPAGAAFVSSTVGLAYDDSTGEWTVGAIPAGSSSTIDIDVTIEALVVSNVAEVSAADQSDVDSQPAENPLDAQNPPDQDDEDIVDVTVEPLADLKLTKEQTGSATFIGDQTSFEITVTNDGPYPATGVEVTDLLPSGLELVSATATQGTYDGTSGVWTVGTLANGDAATLTVTVTVRVTSALNVAQVTAVNEDDPDSSPAENPLDEQSPPDEDDEDQALVQVDELIDLSVDKAVTAVGTHVGDDVTFEVTVANDGPSTATGVVVSDVLPSALSLVSTSATQGSYDDGTGDWTVGALTDGSSAVLTIVATVTTDDEITNVAQVSAADQTDVASTPGNDEPAEDDQDDAVVDLAPLVDLSLGKAVITYPTYIGDTAVFRLTLRNDGPSDATGVVVTDLLPEGLTFVEASAPAAYDEATGAWTVGSLAAGDTRSLDLTVEVDRLSTVNYAQVTGLNEDDVDSAPAENPLDAQSPPDQDDEDSAPLTVAPLADLSLTKDQTGTPTYIGDAATFVVTVTNDGPSEATGIVVTDQLPAGLDFVSATASQGSYDETTGDWAVGAIEVDASATLTITATVTATSVRNFAEITAVSENDPDSQPGENPLDEQSPPDQDDEDDATVEVDELIDLSLDKSVTDSGTYVGDEVTFDITVANDGPSTATGVAVADVLPAGLELVSATATQGTFDETTGRWDVGELADAQSEVLTIVATVTTDDEITNTAQVIEAEQDDADSTPGNDDPAEDDQDDAIVDLDPLVDLSLDKELISAATYVGDSATFRITVSNDGPSDATGVVVRDRLPEGLVFESADTPGVYDADTGLWTVGTLAAGDSRSLELTVTVERLSTVNYAQVMEAAEDDVDSTPGENPLNAENPPDEDDEDSAPLTVAPLADLSLTKTSSPGQVEQGDEATFTIVVRNDGPSPATGVEVTDQLPAGVTFVSSDATLGSYDATSGVWSVGSLAVDEEATLDIVVEVTAAGDITNTAQVTAVGEDDPDSTPDNDDPGEDDQDSTTLSSDPLIDLAVGKQVSQDRVSVGDTVTYTVLVTNHGPSPATGVVVGESLPAGVTHVSHDASAGTWDPGTGAWTVGELDVDASATLEITVDVDDAGTITNVAQVIDADQRDVDSQPDEDALDGDNPPNQDDEATVDVVGVLMDLELSIAADATSVNVGDAVTYTVTLTNQGPSDATGVRVDALLPGGLAFVTSTPAVGSYDPATGIWTVGDLGVGETVTLELAVTVTEAGPITVISQVEAADQLDVDSTPANDVASEDDQGEVTVTGLLADLALTKEISDARPALGSEVAYTITVVNEGPSAATGVVVTDLLPEGLDYLRHSGGIYDPATGTWDVGTVDGGSSASLEIVGRVSALGTTTNTAYVTEVDQPDPDSNPGPPAGEDDEDQVDVTPVPARLEGKVWLDLDGDGTFDDDEPPIPGVRVVLYDAEGRPVATTTTESDGTYSFEDLFPGDYTVEVDATSLPTTIAGQTYDPDDVADGRHQVTLEAGANVVDVDFGYEPVEEPVRTGTPAESGFLPRTGAGVVTLVSVALALLGVGVLVLGGRRRLFGSR